MVKIGDYVNIEGKPEIQLYIVTEIKNINNVTMVYVTDFNGYHGWFNEKKLKTMIRSIELDTTYKPFENEISITDDSAIKDIIKKRGGKNL